MPREEEDFFSPVHVPLLSGRPWKMFAGGMHHLILLDEKGECRLERAINFLYVLYNLHYVFVVPYYNRYTSMKQVEVHTKT